MYQTYEYADPNSAQEELFWQPSQSVEKLYSQFEGKRFRILERSEVTVEKEIGAGLVMLTTPFQCLHIYELCYVESSAL